MNAALLERSQIADSSNAVLDQELPIIKTVNSSLLQRLEAATQEQEQQQEQLMKEVRPALVPGEAAAANEGAAEAQAAKRLFHSRGRRAGEKEQARRARQAGEAL